MKCDNCGKEEVNFHYTSNINGNITEKHLCAECAGKLGYADKSPVRPDMSFEDIFTDLFGGRPTKRMMGGYGMVFPTFIIPTMGVYMPDAGYNSADDENDDDDAPETHYDISTEIDGDMKKRRELNVLREQMRKAAEAEDFEKAAALRDSIRNFEIGDNS